MKPMRWSSTLLLVTVATTGLFFVTEAPRAATVNIVNLDGAGEGFNDPTPFAPVGGNPAVTLGQARLNAFQYAADLWGQRLASDVTIMVQASMNPLTCTMTSAVLGSAGAIYVVRGFPNAPDTSTWHSAALSNALAGFDLDPVTNDINAQFNSNLNGNPGCLGGIGWYYGFNASPPGSDIDFVSVVVHEIGHGLGFQTFVNLTTGAKLAGFNDVYMLDLERHGATPALYPNMSNAQRVAAAISDPNLHFIGTDVTTQGLATLSVGISNGHVRMHGPSPAQPGSSVSHWSTALFPNELMEPVYTAPNHNVGLALALMKDIGWTTCATAPVVTSTDTSTVTIPVPLWTIRLEVSNLGPGTAMNVTGLLSSTLPWLTITDANCSYGNIANGGASFGAPDSYTLDLTGYPGGPFIVNHAITWEDACGNVYGTSVPDTLQPPSPPTGIPNGSDVLGYELAQNHPNPFNPSTVIAYRIAQNERVNLAVYDVSGRLVRTLVDDKRVAGENHEVWDGKDDAGQDVSSGVYFYRLEAGNYLKTRRMVLLK